MCSKQKEQHTQVTLVLILAVASLALLSGSLPKAQARRHKESGAAATAAAAAAATATTAATGKTGEGASIAAGAAAGAAAAAAGTHDASDSASASATSGNDPGPGSAAKTSRPALSSNDGDQTDNHINKADDNKHKIQNLFRPPEDTREGAIPLMSSKRLVDRLTSDELTKAIQCLRELLKKIADFKLEIPKVCCAVPVIKKSCDLLHVEHEPLFYSLADVRFFTTKRPGSPDKKVGGGCSKRPKSSTRRPKWTNEDREFDYNK